MRKIILICAALISLAATSKAQNGLPNILSDMRNEVKPWIFELNCKVTKISDKYQYHIGDRQYYVITIEVIDTTYDKQLGILYGKDYRDRKLEMQIVSFVSGLECDGATIKEGKKYRFILTYWNEYPTIGHGEYIPSWKVDGVHISTSTVDRQPMKAEGLDGLCLFYRDTNYIDHK